MISIAKDIPILPLLLLFIIIQLATCQLAQCQLTLDVKYSIETLVGTGAMGFNGDGLVGLNTTLRFPRSVFFDEDTGDLYISDTDNHRVRVLRNSSGLVETVAGNGAYGYSGEGILATNSMLYFPFGIFLSKTKDLYIAGHGTNRIHKVSSLDGKMYTFAGTGTAGYDGEGLLANESRISGPLDVKILNPQETNSNLLQILIADTLGNRIRVVNGSRMNTLVGTGLTDYNGDGLAPLSTNLDQPFAVALDSNSNEIYFTCPRNHSLLRKYDPKTNTVQTVAGMNRNYTHSGDGGLAKFATFSGMKGITFSPISGELFIVEDNHHVIRKISNSGIITTIAGLKGQLGYNGDNSEDATQSLLNYPRGITATMKGELIITDMANNMIRKLTPTCPPGYILNSQQTECIATCYGIIHNSSSVCSSNGNCTSGDTCECKVGFYGLDCSIAVAKLSADAVVTVENLATSELSNKSISSGNSSERIVSIQFPQDFSNYITSQTNLSRISLCTAVDKGGINTTIISNTQTYSTVSELVTITLASINGNKVKVSKLENPIIISFTKPIVSNGNWTCMYLDENIKEWRTDGVETIITSSSIHCLTSHLTSFSVIDVTLKKANAVGADRTMTISQDTILIVALTVSLGGSAIICAVVTIVVISFICILKRKRKPIPTE